MGIFDKLGFNKKSSHYLLEKALDEKDTFLIDRDGIQIMASSLIGKILEVVECSCGITARKGENGVVFSRGIKPLGLVTDADSYQVLCFKKDLVIIHNRLFKSYDILVSNGLKSIVYSDSEFHSSTLLDNDVFYLYYKYKKEDRCVSYIVRVSKEEGCRFIEIENISNIKLFKGFDGTSLYLMCKEQSKYLLNICEVFKNKGDKAELIEWDEYLEALSNTGVDQAEAFGSHKDYTFHFKAFLNSKEEFLQSYSYLTEGEYDDTVKYLKLSNNGRLGENIGVKTKPYFLKEHEDGSVSYIHRKDRVEVFSDKVGCRNNVFLKEEKEVNIKEYKLNDYQIKEFDKVLSNIRKLLKSANMSGTAILYELHNVIYLDVGMERFYSEGNTFKSFNDTVSEKVLGVLSTYVNNTIKSLVRNVPLKVKKIYFTVDGGNLTRGVIRKSSEEKGSVEVLLK